LVNFLTNVGYSFGDDREVFTIQETIERFDITRINEASAAFPVSKLQWLNGVYIREMSDDALVDALLPYLQKAYDAVDVAKVKAIAPHLKERINPLTEAVPMVKFLFAFEAAT